MSDPNKPEDDQDFFEAEFDESFDDQFDEFSEDTYIPDTHVDYGEEDAGTGDSGAYDPTDDTLTNFGDEEWEDFGDEGEFNAEPVQSTGKKPLIGGLSFNAIVIAGAVVVGVAVLIYQVMSAQPTVNSADRFRSALTLTGSTDGMVLGEQGNQQDGQEAQEQESDVGFLNDPALINESRNAGVAAEEGQAALPMPVPMSNSEEETELAGPDVLTPMPDVDTASPAPRPPEEVAPVQTPQEQSAAMDMLLKARQQREEQQAQPEPTPVLPQEPAPEMAAPTPDPVIAQDQPLEEVAPAPAPAEVNNSGALAQENTQLREQVSTLTTRLETMEQEMKRLSEGRSGEVDQMEKQIASLKQELKETKEASAKTEAAAPKEAAAPVPAAAPKKPAVAPKPAVREPAYSPPPASAVRWELRAAQPGRAWVSKEGSREMQTVQVGDTLAGIGQVTQIELAGGRWSVVGTQGRIAQ